MKLKNEFYFPHDVNARNDEKLIKLQQDGLDLLGIYWCLIELLYEAGGYLELDCERIAFNLRTDSERIARVINEYNLFEIDKKKFTNKRVLETLKYRKSKSEKARKNAKVKWKNYYANAEHSQSGRNANAMQEKKRKEKKIIRSKNLKKPYKDFTRVICNDGTVALRRYGKWVDDKDHNVKLDLSYYKELQ